VIYSELLTGDGQEMFEHAAKLGWGRDRVKTSRRPVPIGANRSLA
jgi:hypothetical protein